MARARNIKPGFYTNEDLVECSFAARLLFPGLWMLSDREGRLEDRPKKIKMAIFPADSIDINELLAELEVRGFIKRYEADGKKVISIPQFLDHQNPHGREQDSVLPDENGFYKVNTRKNDMVTGEFVFLKSLIDIKSNAETKQEHNKHHASTIQEHNKHHASPADSLIPDSLIPDNTIDTSVSIVVNDKTIPDCPHQEIITLYKTNLPMGIQPKAWDGARAATLKSRWRERKERQSLAWWGKFFGYVAQSKFLTGQVSGNDRKAFEITLPWILKAENFNKIVEGFYHR
jgi:hypothetical protein